MTWILSGAILAMFAYLIFGIVTSYRETFAREREAYNHGYKTMKGLLVTPGNDSDQGYDSGLVLRSCKVIMDTLTGDDYQKNSITRGMRDAITEYEREFGAP